MTLQNFNTESNFNNKSNQQIFGGWKRLEVNSSYLDGVAGRNFSKDLFDVDDNELRSPGRRFVDGKEEPFFYTDAAMNAGGIFHNSYLPQGLLNFIKGAVSKFNLTHSEFLDERDAAYEAMSYIDYYYPYYVLDDAPVQISQKHLQYTFKLESSHRGRAILNPSKIESFEFVPDYNYSTYSEWLRFISSPAVNEILLRGYAEINGQRKTIEDLYQRWASIIGVELEIAEDVLINHYDFKGRGVAAADKDLMDPDTIRQMDKPFFMICYLTALTWMKSPKAMSFLVEEHPVYREILMVEFDPIHKKEVIDQRTGLPKISLRYPDKMLSNVVIAADWTLLSANDLEVIPNQKPGTCMSCGNILHCTKYVNASAIDNPICSCGKVVEVDDVDGDVHGYSSNCSAYQNAHPLNVGFMCIRCLRVRLENASRPEHSKLGSEAGCARFECPNYYCTFHAGRKAYVNELTKKRVQSLPYNVMNSMRS